MMNIAQLKRTQEEASRFIAAAGRAIERLTEENNDFQTSGYIGTAISFMTHVSPGSIETGAARRASLDLTRSLASLRSTR